MSELGEGAKLCANSLSTFSEKNPIGVGDRRSGNFDIMVAIEQGLLDPARSPAGVSVFKKSGEREPVAGVFVAVVGVVGGKGETQPRLGLVFEISLSSFWSLLPLNTTLGNGGAVKNMGESILSLVLSLGSEGLRKPSVRT